MSVTTLCFMYLFFSDSILSHNNLLQCNCKYFLQTLLASFWKRPLLYKQLLRREIIEKRLSITPISSYKRILSAKLQQLLLRRTLNRSAKRGNLNARNPSGNKIKCSNSWSMVAFNPVSVFFECYKRCSSPCLVKFATASKKAVYARKCFLKPT